jgi:hypothetical protein
MRRVWTDGSSALKPHRYSYYDNQFHRRVDVEYVQPPLKQGESADLESQIIKSKPKAKPQEEYAINTNTIQLWSLGLIWTTKWINLSIAFIIALCGVLEWGLVLFSQMDITTRAELIWQSGLSTAIVATIILLLYRYNIILDKRFDNVERLKRRAKIVNSFKKTLFMLARALLCLYGVLIPQIAKVILAIL